MVDRSSDRTTGGVRAPIVRRITAMFDRFRPFTRFLSALPFSPASAARAWRVWHLGSCSWRSRTGYARSSQRPILGIGREKKRPFAGVESPANAQNELPGTRQTRAARAHPRELPANATKTATEFAVAAKEKDSRAKSPVAESGWSRCRPEGRVSSRA